MYAVIVLHLGLQYVCRLSGIKCTAYHFFWVTV